MAEGERSIIGKREESAGERYKGISDLMTLKQKTIDNKTY